MSLYIIGGLVESEHGTNDLRRALDEIARRTGIVVAYDLDDDDKDYLASVLKFSSDGVFFTLCDKPGSPDVTSHWTDALTAARLFISGRIPDVTLIRMADIESLNLDEYYFDAIRRTLLGECLSAIICQIKAEHGGISIFDGASEGEIRLASKECENEILRTMVLTWDCLPNLTYIW
jgi:hypothetical protein